MLSNEQAIQLWKQNNINKCEMKFSCGGDSMGDTEFAFFDKKNENVDCDLLIDFFEREVYNHIQFYEASDGYYMGEFGEVIIELEIDNGVEQFTYCKNATAEFEESYTEKLGVSLTNEELTFINEKVMNINGGDWGEPNINYKIDCIITERDEEMIEELIEKITKNCETYEFEEAEGEEHEDYQWTTNDDGLDIEIQNDKLTILITKRFTQTRPSED